MFKQFFLYLLAQWNHEQCCSRRTLRNKKGKFSHVMYCTRPKHHFGLHMDNTNILFPTEPELAEET